MKNMLGIDVGLPVLPSEETRLAFITHYAAVSAARLEVLRHKPDAWFQEPTAFFDTTRSRAWVLVRRFTHSAHHRGQLTAYLRLWGQPLFSTYGPTADTGGLPKNGATVVYRYDSVEDLLAHHGGAQVVLLRTHEVQPLAHRVPRRRRPAVDHHASGLAFGVRVHDANARRECRTHGFTCTVLISV